LAERCSDGTSISIPVGLGTGAALVSVSVPVGKGDGSKVADVLLGVLVQRGLAADKDGADLGVHLRVLENHGQVVPGGLVNVHGLINDHALDARQLNGLAANELLEAGDAAEDDVGVGEEHVLVARVSEVDGGSGQLGASVVGENDTIHPDGRIHVIVADKHKLVGTSEDALFHLIFSDGNGVVSALLKGQQGANLHDDSGHAASSSHELGRNDAEAFALLQSLNQIELFDPHVDDSQGLVGTSDTVVDCAVPFHGRLSGLDAIMAAWEALVQSDNY
jgi:hypothetical protein